MKTKKELINLLENAEYAELFKQLNDRKKNNEAYSALKKSFILGKTDVDFHDRLRILIEDESISTIYSSNYFNKKYLFYFLIIVISLSIFIALSSKDTITGIDGNENRGNSVNISK